MTAVEWLQQRHVEVNWSRNRDEISLKYADELREDYFNQAKEMEKQQIIDARNNGFEASGEGWNGEYGIKDFNFLTEEIESEQYYNETFKNK